MIYKMIEVISSKRNCITISCSLGEHQETLKLTKRATYINNGINIKKLKNIITICNTNMASNDKSTIFTIGRICHQKNPRMFNEIAEKMPAIRFVWIGDGELREQLTSRNIEITGWQERSKTLEIALAADVFILTSLWEGLPISLLEAMYLKKLCIVSNVIGNKDVIKNGVNGYVCNTIDDFCEAVEMATKKNDNIKHMAQIGFEDIEVKYNTAIMANVYNNVYKKSLNPQNMGGGYPLNFKKKSISSIQNYLLAIKKMVA